MFSLDRQPARAWASSPSKVIHMIRAFCLQSAGSYSSKALSSISYPPEHYSLGFTNEVSPTLCQHQDERYHVLVTCDSLKELCCFSLLKEPCKLGQCDISTSLAVASQVR
jgi:hypothetical protein